MDIDLEKFFDRVNHDKLMSEVEKRIRDKRVVKLIRSYLRAGVLEGGLVIAIDEGTPQGGPLSPLLSNLLLDKFDRELEKRGHRFVRYGGDCNIYVRTYRAGGRVMSSIAKFLTRKLKVNAEKSAVARPWKHKILGFTFSGHSDPKRGIAPQAIKRFKAMLRAYTGRTRGISLERMIEELRVYLTGWGNYFGFCEMLSKSSFALLVMTGEDKDENCSRR